MSKKLVAVIFIIAFIDQIIKGIVLVSMEIGSSLTLIGNFFSITYVENEGAAFSILSGNTILLIVLSLFALNILYFLFLKEKNVKKTQMITIGILMGGIIGNLVDRILYGHVIDYLDFCLFGYNFPVFNFADICIVLSTIFLLYITLKEEKDAKNCSRKFQNAN